MKNPSESPAPVPPFLIDHPDAQSVPLVFASPHSGRDYPADFVAGQAGSGIASSVGRRFVDDLFAAAPSSARLLRATFPRAFIDANREPFELDQGMFSDKLPDYVNTDSSRVAARLGTIARVVSSGQDIYPRKLTFSEAAERIRAFYRPYHKALETLIHETRKRFGYAVVVDYHSMPSIGGPLDPDVGHGRADFVVGDCFGSTCAPYITDAIECTIAGFGYAVPATSRSPAASRAALRPARRRRAHGADRDQPSALYERGSDRKERRVRPRCRTDDRRDRRARPTDCAGPRR